MGRVNNYTKYANIGYEISKSLKKDIEMPKTTEKIMNQYSDLIINKKSGNNSKKSSYESKLELMEFDINKILMEFDINKILMDYINFVWKSYYRLINKITDLISGKSRINLNLGRNRKKVSGPNKIEYETIGSALKK